MSLFFNSGDVDIFCFKGRVVLFIFQKPPPVSSERFSKTKILCNGLQPTPPLEEKGGEIFVVQFILNNNWYISRRMINLAENQ